MSTPAFAEDPFDHDEEDDEEPLLLAPREGVCRVCGCTDRKACIGADGNPCHWVTPTLCSACMEP